MQASGAIHRYTCTLVSRLSSAPARDLDSNTHEHSPSSDKDFLFAIVKDANQLALVAAIAWLRSGTLDLLSAASGAAKPRKLARHHAVHIIGTYAFKDRLTTRPFPAMRSDYRYRTWCRLGEGREMSLEMRGNQPVEPEAKITRWPIVHVPPIAYRRHFVTWVLLS